MFALRWIGKGLKWVGGAIVAPVARLRQVNGIGRIVRCIVHVVAICAVLGVLGWANYFFGLDAMLRTPWPVLRLVWLPLLFLLTYALVWLGWYVCRAIAADGEDSAFPDIDSAWRNAMTQASRAGIDIVKTPLYLLVGRPRGQMRDLIHAAGVPLISASSANDEDTVVQVFANREAIFVSCAEVSLLGRQAELFAHAASQRDHGDTPWPEQSQSELADADIDLDAIPIDSPQDGDVAVAIQTHPVAAATYDRITELEGHVATLVDEHSPEKPTVFTTETAESTLLRALLKDAVEVETISARLRYLCQLIVEQRRPCVPVNAVILMASADALDCDETAGHVGVLSSEDLNAIHETAQVDCPHLFLVCDMETLPGGRELIARFPAEQRHRRLGVRLPEVSAADRTESAELINEAIRWLCDCLLPPLVYRLICTPQSTQDDATAVGSNTAMYKFLNRCRQRRERLARLLRRAVISGQGRIDRLAGCYLVATGEDGQREQGFVEAVFAQLPEMAQTVKWTPQAIRRDQRQRRLARIGYAALATLAAILIVAAFAF